MHSHFSLLRFVALAITLILPTGSAEGTPKLATPPTAKNLLGVWIGFDRDELTFTRLELREGSAGFLARVSPADTVLHVDGVHLYRITEWRLDGWNLEIRMSPLSNATKVGYVKGRVGLASLRLTISGPENGGWKEEPLLYPESRLTISNQETKDKIEAADKN
jgi:hypothetical protein